MRETVRWQIQSLVSKRAMIESAPPVARYLPVGESSVVRQEAVCPCSMNSVDSPSLTAWLTWRTGSSSGYERILIFPSVVGRNTFFPLQQKAIWFVSTDSWRDETTTDLVGDIWKSSPRCGTALGQCRPRHGREGHEDRDGSKPTRFPTSSEEPSGAQARLWASPRPFTSLTHVLVLTSQSLTTPSLLTLQSSASLTGLKAIFSIPAECPLSSVEKRTFGLSGFPDTHAGQDGHAAAMKRDEAAPTHRHEASCPTTLWRQVCPEDSRQWNVDYTAR